MDFIVTIPLETLTFSFTETWMRLRIVFFDVRFSSRSVTFEVELTVFISLIPYATGYIYTNQQHKCAMWTIALFLQYSYEKNGGNTFSNCTSETYYLKRLAMTFHKFKKKIIWKLNPPRVHLLQVLVSSHIH